MKPHRFSSRPDLATIIVCLLLILILGAMTVVAQDPASDPDIGQTTIGKKLYHGYCSSCHGNGGQGDGALAELLTITPKDLTKFEKDGKFPFDEVVTAIDGSEQDSETEMPAFGEIFMKAEDGANKDIVMSKITALTNYIWSIQVK